jgi:hypothetical protein
LNLFPPDVARKEIAYYNTVMDQYGLSLDSRKKVTKTDWSVWTATLADNQVEFESLVSPIYDYLNQTTARDPLADSYQVVNIKSRGMHARPVVGGVFIRLLDDKALWQKWAAAAEPSPVPFQAEPLPVPPPN